MPISGNYVSIYSSYQTHQNQKCDHKHWYTFHIIGIYHWTNMPIISHKYTSLAYQCSLHVGPHITAHKGKTNCNSYFPCYNHICANNKYASWIVHISHICQLLHVYIWDYYISIYTSYVLTAINNVTRSSHIHYTLLAYAPVKICLPHCTCVPW